MTNGTPSSTQEIFRLIQIVEHYESRARELETGIRNYPAPAEADRRDAERRFHQIRRQAMTIRGQIAKMSKAPALNGMILLDPIFPMDSHARQAGGKAKDAQARALVALRMLASQQPWNDGFERGMDDCFEMGDGDDVVRHILALVDTHPELLALFERHRGYFDRATLDQWRKWAADNPPAQLGLELVG